MKIFFWDLFFNISFERKRHVLVITRLPPKTWQIIIERYWFWMNRKILIAFSHKNILLIMVHSFRIPYKEGYGLQIYSWVLMAFVKFRFPLPCELLWSVTLVNSRALFLQCLCISGKHSTGLFAETWLVLVLFCHLDFCLGSQKIHLSHRAKDFSCFCICTYVCSHMWIHTDMFIYMCKRSHCCEVLVQTSTIKLKFWYAQFISSLHISFHWLKNGCMWQKHEKPL